MTRSKILDNESNNEISPLCNGFTLDDFNSVGYISVCKHWLIKKVNCLGNTFLVHCICLLERLR